VIFQIPKFLRVPESRVVGEHFGLLFGSGTRDPGELRVTKVYISGFPLLFPFMEFSLCVQEILNSILTEFCSKFTKFMVLVLWAFQVQKASNSPRISNLK